MARRQQMLTKWIDEHRGLARFHMMVATGVLSALIIGLGAVGAYEAVEAASENEWRLTLDDLERLEAMVDRHSLEEGTLPDDLEEVVGCTPVDPWGTPYVYERRGETGYVVYSLGSDREQGTIEDVYLAGRK